MFSKLGFILYSIFNFLLFLTSDGNVVIDAGKQLQSKVIKTRDVNPNMLNDAQFDYHPLGTVPPHVKVNLSNYQPQQRSTTCTVPTPSTTCKEVKTTTCKEVKTTTCNRTVTPVATAGKGVVTPFMTKENRTHSTTPCIKHVIEQLCTNVNNLNLYFVLPKLCVKITKCPTGPYKLTTKEPEGDAYYEQ